MLTKDQILKILELKKRGYSQEKVAGKLKMSRSTVQRHWKGKRVKIDDVFVWGKCKNCNSPYPIPKFLGGWKCPACKEGVDWVTPWF